VEADILSYVNRVDGSSRRIDPREHARPTGRITGIQVCERDVNLAPSRGNRCWAGEGWSFKGTKIEAVQIKHFRKFGRMGISNADLSDLAALPQRDKKIVANLNDGLGRGR